MLNPPICLAKETHECFQCFLKPAETIVEFSNQELVTFEVVTRSLAIAKLPMHCNFVWEHIARRQTLKCMKKAYEKKTKLYWVVALGCCADWYTKLKKYQNTLDECSNKRIKIRQQLLKNFYLLVKKHLENLHLQCQVSDFEKEMIKMFKSFNLKV